MFCVCVCVYVCVCIRARAVCVEAALMRSCWMEGEPYLLL